MAIETSYLASTRNKTLGDLALELLWFSVHSLTALATLVLTMGAMTLTHPDPEQSAPKVLASALAFLMPMLVGFSVVRGLREHRHVAAARSLWIAAALLFVAVSVWVLDLPTGAGLCEGCGAIEKLQRTFFSINHGSGLLGGDGLLAGAWIPLALVGYAAGAALSGDRRRDGR